jgi:hypothetical protein
MNILTKLLTSRHRWTNYGSPNAKDTFTIQLPRPRDLIGLTFDSVVLQDHEDTLAGSITCPAAVEVSDAADVVLHSFPSFMSGCDSKKDTRSVFFDRTVTTDTIHLTLTPQNDAFVGLYELELWSAANPGPYYYAVDASYSGCEVVFDPNSSATPNGAVLTAHTPDSVISFSGVQSRTDDGVNTLRIEYKNNGTTTPSFGVTVNDVAAGNVTTQFTPGAGYSGVEVVGVQLNKGSNVVTVYGGGDGMFVSGLGVEP